MFALSPFDWSLIASVAICIGLTKAGIPGLGIVIVPVMASVFPAKVSTGILLPMLIIGDILAVCYYRRHADWWQLLRLLPFAVIGVVIGFLIMGAIDDILLKRVIGAVVLVLIALTLTKTGAGLEHRSHAIRLAVAGTVGITAGLITMLANAAGPLMTIYFLAMNLNKERFIGTRAWYFLILNCIKVPFSHNLGFITMQSLVFNVTCLPAIALGVVIGIFLVKRVQAQHYRYLVLVLAAASAIRLVAN